MIKGLFPLSLSVVWRFLFVNNMATKRMFSKNIIRTDKFLDMPPTTQNLYFHFGMEADDDGFVSSPKTIIKTTGAADDDIKILTAKGFVIPFESGIIIITDWKENNLIRSDRYNPTIHQNELKMLALNNNVYKMAELGIPVVATGKVRLGKNIYIHSEVAKGD